MHANLTALRLSPALLLLASLAAAPSPAQDQPAAAPAAPPAAAPAAAAATDPQAHRIASQVMDALGGRAAWDSTRYLRFSFAGRRSHLWDKATGRHRMEGQIQGGQHFVVIEDLNTREGRAWVEGNEATGENLANLLKAAYGAWVNDTYWLLMPYKLEDPGVHLTYAGEETVDGHTYDKLHLSFDKVGLTPGDEYWAYIDRNTHLMDRWAYHLESMKPEEPATAWLWQGWQRFGRIQLAPHRVQVGEPDRKLELSDISVADSMPDTAFTSPAPLPAP